MFADLLASQGVVEELDVAGPVGVMALHGGLERGTAEVAHMVADLTGCSRYAVVQPDHLRWHVPSIRYDPVHSRRLSAFLDHVDVAVSFHGYGRRGLERTVLLGGRNRVLAARLRGALQGETDLSIVAELDRIPPKLRGLHPANPVNVPRFDGVQIELPTSARGRRELLRIAVAVGAVIRQEWGRPVR